MKITGKRKLSIGSLIGIVLLASLSIILITGTGTYTAKAETSEVDPLSYTLISGGYAVSLSDRNVKKIIIPNEHLGQPIIEIKANGFLSAPNLESITIPETVTKINNSAFMNCPLLSTVNFVTVRDELTNEIKGITQIGQLAFGMCPKLKISIIPSTIKNVDINPTAFYNNTTDVTYRGLESVSLTNFLGSVESDPFKIIYFDFGGLLLDDEGNPACSVMSYQGIVDESGIIEIPLENDGRRVMEIWPSAFDNCYAEELRFSPQFKIHNKKIKLFSQAFWNSKIKNIILDDCVEIEDEGLFSESGVVSVTFPDKMTFIPDKTFYKCHDLKNVVFNGNQNKLSSKIRSIGTEAFAECYAINYLYIPETVENVGTAIFTGWKKPQVIELLSRVDVPQSWTANNWLGVGVDPDIVKTASTKLKITLKVNNPNAGNDYFINVDPNSTLNDMINSSEYSVPTSPTENFTGKWYLDANFINEFSPEKKFEENTILYARWEPKTFLITFSENKYVTFQAIKDGPVEIGDSFSFVVTVNQEYNKSEPKIYAGATELTKTKIDSNKYVCEIKNIRDSVTISVGDMAVNASTVTFKNTETTLGTATVEFGSLTYKFEQPIWIGRTFLYWSDSNGKPYTDYLGNGIIVWDIASDVDMHAVWDDITYTVKFDSNGGSAINNVEITLDSSGPLPEPTLKWDRFDCWKDIYGNCITDYSDLIKNLKELYSSTGDSVTIKLTAYWQAVRPVMNASGDKYLKDKIIIADFMQSPVGINGWYYIYSSVEEITFHDEFFGGKYTYTNLTIYVLYRTTPLTINFSDFKYSAAQGNSALYIDGCEVTVRYFGINSITGGNGYIGSTGSTGSGVGATGNKGANGTLFSPDGKSGYGGGQGSVGGTGGKGGTGCSAIYLFSGNSAVTFNKGNSTSKMELIGGRGGTGGTGGKGGTGGTGGNGGDGYKSILINGAGGAGGYGGYGGWGGNGGAGGDGGAACNKNISGDATIITGEKGATGSVGSMGDTGSRGNNGKSYSGIILPPIVIPDPGLRPDL